MRKASVELRVAFADLDGMRAVYHTNYIRWFDLARTKLFREAGFSMGKMGGRRHPSGRWWCVTVNIGRARSLTIL